MRIFSVTWNTHGTRELPILETTADLITISLQECYSSPDMSILGKEFEHRVSKSMFGLQTVILSKSRIEAKTIRIGLGPCGFVNKGFIATRINRSILHINAHLQAHDHNHEKRLRQLKSILEFCKGMEVATGQRTDTVILSGDLNFRMKGGLDQAVDFLRLFPQFKESKIKFQPTYKYKGGALVPSRTPSYCDRIFVASRHDLKFLKYTSMPQIVASDHKPVVCEFCVIEANSEAPENGTRAEILNSEARSMLFRRMSTNAYLLCIDNASILSGSILLLVCSVLGHVLLSAMKL